MRCPACFLSSTSCFVFFFFIAYPCLQSANPSTPHRRGSEILLITNNMDHNGRYYQDVEQQMQDCNENQEQQYPVNTFVDSEFQNQGQILNQDVAGCSMLIDEITYGIQQNCSVYNNAQTFQGHPQNRQMRVPVQIQDEYKLWYCSEFIHKKDDNKGVSDYYTPIAEIIFRNKSQAPAPKVLQEEPILDEAAGKSVSTPDAGNTSDYLDEYKPWYIREFIHKNDDEEVSVYHKLATKIVKKKSRGPAPKVLQQEQILDEAAGETGSTPDAETTLDYPENLWELICKFCPAESSVSSLLAYHLCDMSLVKSQNNSCNTCFSRLPSGMTMKSHKKTRRHCLLLLNYKRDTKIDELFYCSTCNVQCDNFAAYTNHLLSQKHVEFEECLSFDLYFCNSCKLTMDATASEVHLSSKTHLINSMIINIRSYCSISKLGMSNLNCKTCKEKCLNEKSYKAHLYSVKHCSNLLQLKLKDDFSHSNQYVFFNNRKYVCVLCKINIGDRASLLYHFLTDEHMTHEVSFQKFQYEKFISKDFHFTSHFKEHYLKCSECRTFNRNCEHMFKNANEYLAWKEKIEKGKYCIYCNCFSDQSHKSTELHKKMKEAVNYCRLCDKVLTIDIVKHKQGTRHMKTMKEFGTRGVEPKRGPSKIFCGICDLTSDTERSHLQHLAGVHHRTKYNMICIEHQFHCKPCNFTVTDLYQYEEHEKSTDHVEKLNKIEKQFDCFKFCFICRQPVTNGTLSEHNKTVQHLHAIKLFNISMQSK